MKIKKVSKRSTIIQKGTKYFYHKINPYTKAEELTEITFVENGNGQIGHNSYSCYTREKLDLLFSL